MHLDDALGDQQAETGSALLARDRAVGLLELLEDLGLRSQVARFGIRQNRPDQQQGQPVWDRDRPAGSEPERRLTFSPTAVLREGFVARVRLCK